MTRAQPMHIGHAIDMATGRMERGCIRNGLVRVDARGKKSTYEDEGRMEDMATRTEDQRARSGVGPKPEGVADIRQAKGVC
jgi:hypothetical protein